MHFEIGTGHAAHVLLVKLFQTFKKVQAIMHNCSFKYSFYVFKGTCAFLGFVVFISFNKNAFHW